MIGENPPERFDRAQIELLPADHDQAVDESVEALANLGGIYQQGGRLVHVVETAPSTARQKAKAQFGIAIAAVTLPLLREQLAKSTTFLVKRKRRDGAEEMATVPPPRHIAEAILARDEWPFPSLTGVITTPTLRPDFSLLADPGHDEITGLYAHTDFDAFQYAGLLYDDLPLDSAKECCNQLLEIFDEFPFADGYGRSVALAMMLTALVRHALPSAPLFGISATLMGSGKTYMAQLPALLALGQQAPVIAPARDAKEEAKAIFAFLLDGAQILLIDNVDRTQQSDMLSALLTSETYKDRVLSASRGVAVSTAVTIIVTGNGLQFAGDLASRALVIHLDPETDHPEHRKFSRNLVEWIPANRARLVAALNFLRAWVCTREKHTAEPWARFPEWDHLIRGAILWAALPDPLLALRAGEKADPRRVEHEAVMGHWHAAFGHQPTPVRRAVQEAKSLAVSAADDQRFLDALLDVAGERGEVNVKRLGKWLAKLAGRIQGGMRIVQGPPSRGSQTWSIEIVGERSDMWV